MLEQLYDALQLLRDRDDVSRDELGDAAVWATQVLGRELVDRERTPEDLLAVCLAASRTSLREVKGAALLDALQAPALAIALRVCTLNAKSFAAFASPALRELALVQCRIKPARLRALLAKPLAIARLDLGSNQLGDDGADILANTESLPGLRELDLASTHMSVAAIARLLTGPALHGLRRWKSGNDKHGAALGTALARGPETLRSITIIRDHEFGSAGLQAFAQRSKLRLRELTFHECGIDDSGVAALARSEQMSELRELRFRSNPTGRKSLVAIATSPHLARLRTLKIAQAYIDADAIEALAASVLRIESLDLWANPRIGPNALATLGAGEALRGVRELVLGGRGNGGDAALEALAESDWFPALDSLSL
ncbi:MAG TPA: hypothetical protein VGG28_20620, partial [Kofleriaceae bacterium]